MSNFNELKVNFEFLVKCYLCVRGLVQSPCGKINIIMTLGGGGGLGTALSADFSFSCDYAYLWLNKSGHTSSSVKICIFATGKQLQDMQVCNESIKT